MVGAQSLKIPQLHSLARIDALMSTYIDWNRSLTATFWFFRWDV